MTQHEPTETLLGWVSPVSCDGPGCLSECTVPIADPWFTLTAPPYDRRGGKVLHFCSWRCLSARAYDAFSGAGRGSDSPSD